MSELGGELGPTRDQHWLGGRRPSMRPPARIQSRAAIAVVALVVGFLVAVQAAGSEDRPLSRLAGERPEDLTRILADLNEEADRLAQELAALRVRLARYRGSARSDEAAIRDARKTLADLQVLSGLVPVEGPGVAVSIEDQGGRVSWEMLLDLIQELRDAGAEAIDLNGTRVAASTWLGPTDAGVVVDGTGIEPPYVLEAVGPPDVVAEALDIPGGPLSLLEALPGVSAEVAQVARLVLPRAGPAG